MLMYKFERELVEKYKLSCRIKREKIILVHAELADNFQASRRCSKNGGDEK